MVDDVASWVTCQHKLPSVHYVVEDVAPNPTSNKAIYADDADDKSASCPPPSPLGSSGAPWTPWWSSSSACGRTVTPSSSRLIGPGPMLCTLLCCIIVVLATKNTMAKPSTPRHLRNRVIWSNGSCSPHHTMPWRAPVHNVVDDVALTETLRGR